MSLLSDGDRENVKRRLDAELVDPVRVVVFSEPVTGLYLPGRRECVSCRETEALTKEVAELSDKIHLEIHNVREEPELTAQWQVALTPTISVSREEDSGVRFLGVPAGFEFASFLETLISASAADGTGLQQETLTKINALDSDLEIKIFVTPT